MSRLRKAGGIAALIEAATFIVGIAIGFTLLAPFMTGELNPDQTVAFIADNHGIMVLWNQIIYLLFGAVLVVLSLALHGQLKKETPELSKTAAAFGLIWAGLVFASGMIFNVGMKTVIDLDVVDPARAATVWLAVNTVHEGLGGGNEIVGGLWILILSWAAIRGSVLSKVLNVFGMVIGAIGVVSVIPAISGISGLVFGLGTIVWFLWLGIVLLAKRGPEAD